MKLDPESIAAWAALHKKPLAIAMGLLVLLAGLLFAADRFHQYRDDRFAKKKKAEIANTITEIGNVQGQIKELEGKKSVLTNQVENDTKTLANSMSVREDDRVATNQALENYNKALASNTNTDVTAADLQRQLDRLPD